MKLFAWTKDFNPTLQNSTTTQVWVKIYRLSQKYWCPKILVFAITSSIGTPICTDSASINHMVDRTFGQFVRVLVDMDVTKTPRYYVLVKRKGFFFLFFLWNYIMRICLTFPLIVKIEIEILSYHVQLCICIDLHIDLLMLF